MPSSRASFRVGGIWPGSHAKIYERQYQMEIEILKKAAAYFAKELR